MSDPVPAARRFSGGPPAWVFLEELASFGDVRNATTATGVTSAGRAVDVTFELVDPPGVSRWFVHCPGLEEDRGFNGSPQILNAAGALVVMRMLFVARRGRVIDYFVYRAGPGWPSLDLVPGPAKRSSSPNSFKLEIFVFSSETRAWSSRVATFSWDEETTYDEELMHTPTKAVAAGGGSLAWIDLWRGLRDATMSNGVIRFVELQLRYGDHGWTAPPAIMIPDNDGVNELADLKRLVSATPRLSLQDEDVVYIEARTRMRPGDSKSSLLLTVNATEERLEAAEQITLRLRLSRRTFSRFLDASPACE
ncbi:hypothetical protein SETIT_9G438000v2 [Setaria italica]|uniref:DUF1618 domain-containing protein n=1 Tax=Setaria italica TaxID=4555 RepID=A0A368SS48_SETIT|nr:hypothetical protein SETIT_9G438000v2 [Setaria italica]